MSTRYGLDRAFTVLVTAAALVGVVVLALLLVDVVKDGSDAQPGVLDELPLADLPRERGHLSRPDRVAVAARVDGPDKRAARARGRSVPRGVRPGHAHKQDDRDQHLQPRRGALGDLRSSRPGHLRGASGAGNGRRERAHRRAHAELAHPAGHHRRHQGGPSGPSPTRSGRAATRSGRRSGR